MLQVGRGRMDEDVVEVIFVEDAGGADGTREDERRYDSFCTSRCVPCAVINARKILQVHRE